MSLIENNIREKQITICAQIHKEQREFIREKKFHYFLEEHRDDLTQHYQHLGSILPAHPLHSFPSFEDFCRFMYQHSYFS